MFCFKLFFVLFKMIPLIWSKEALLKAIYWEQKPFIFKNSDGYIDGIIPKIFQEGENYCKNELENYTLISFDKQLQSRNMYINLLRSNVQYGEKDLLEFNQENTIWFPDDSFTTKQNKSVKDKGLILFEFIKSEGLAVIVPRYMISLPNKMVRGIYACRQILTLAFMLALLFGMIIWFAECTYNNEFSPFFFKGAGTGFWWSFVSMTTVGYGDIVPRSIAGRMIACFWLFIGVVIAALMTATVSETIHGLDGLNIREKKVSVLEDSYELRAVKEMYAADVVPVESYKEALNLVRNGTVFSAVINADVAAWLQKEIIDDNQDVPLRIITVIPATLYINCLIPTNLSKSAKDVFNCMFDQRDEVYTRPYEQFQKNCHNETLYIDSVTEMFQKSTLYQLILGFLVVLVCLGLGFELWTRGKACSKKPKT